MHRTGNHPGPVARAALRELVWSRLARFLVDFGRKQRSSAVVTNVLEVNPERLWESLERSAEIGRFRDVGLRRLALSAEDKQMRDLFVDWAKSAGCRVEIEAEAILP